MFFCIHFIMNFKCIQISCDSNEYKLVIRLNKCFILSSYRKISSMQCFMPTSLCAHTEAKPNSNRYFSQCSQSSIDDCMRHTVSFSERQRKLPICLSLASSNWPETGWYETLALCKQLNCFKYVNFVVLLKPIGDICQL